MHDAFRVFVFVFCVGYLLDAGVILSGIASNAGSDVLLWRNTRGTPQCGPECCSETKRRRELAVQNWRESS